MPKASSSKFALNPEVAGEFFPARAISSPARGNICSLLPRIETKPLPVVLFPASLPAARKSRLHRPLPASWRPGTRLSLRGPLGHGFDLPRGVKKVALAAFHAPPALLFPLARLALDRGAAVAFYSAEPPAGLPMDIEVLPLDMLADALSWADFLAAALHHANLAPFRRACGLGGSPPFPSRRPGTAPHAHAMRRDWRMRLVRSCHRSWWKTRL